MFGTITSNLTCTGTTNDIPKVKTRKVACVSEKITNWMVVFVKIANDSTRSKPAFAEPLRRPRFPVISRHYAAQYKIPHN